MAVGVLKIAKREKPNTGTSKKLRRQGYVPASISSKGKESVSVTVKADDLRKGMAAYGRNALFKLEMEGYSVMSMVRDIQVSPVKGEMLNVDFQEVSLNEEIRADLTIVLKGMDVLEFKKLMALRQTDIITVKGLPQHIPDDIIIDVSNIDKAHNVFLKDVKFPDGIVPEGDPEQIVVSIVEAKRIADDVEEETAAPEETADSEEKIDTLA